MNIITDDDIAIIEAVEVHYALILSNRAKNEACLKILKTKAQSLKHETNVAVKIEDCEVEDYESLPIDEKRRRLDEEINLFQRQAHDKARADGVKQIAAAHKKADEECNQMIFDEYRRIDENIKRKRRQAYIMLEEQDKKYKEAASIMLKEEPKEFVGVVEAKTDDEILIGEEAQKIVPVLIDEEAKEVSTTKRRSKRGASGKFKK